MEEVTLPCSREQLGLTVLGRSPLASNLPLRETFPSGGPAFQEDPGNVCHLALLLVSGMAFLCPYLSGGAESA